MIGFKLALRLKWTNPSYITDSQNNESRISKKINNDSLTQ